MTEPGASFRSTASVPRQAHRSLADMLRHRVKATPNSEAFSHPDADEWRTLTWQQVGERARDIAMGLRSLGIKDEERVGIISSTRIDWILADFGIMLSGGATTAIYPSTAPDDCAYIIDNSGSVIVFAENDDQVEKLVSIRDSIKGVQQVVHLEGGSGHDGWVISIDELESKGRAARKEDPAALDALIDAIEPSRLATLIYTSGTTGKPKGVELTHDNWMYTAEAIDELGILSADDKQFLWLPLSHSFGKMLLSMVVHIGIPTAVDGRVDKIVENLEVIRPTFMAAAPRIFEKVYNRVVTGAQESGGLKYSIFRRAFDVGREVSRLSQHGQRASGLLSVKHRLAQRLVFSKLEDRFGGRIRFFISGSAALSKEIAEFFHASGLLVLEGYGLTESSAASFVNVPSGYSFGTVGAPLPGTEVRVAEDGEVMIRSRGIMRGYHGLLDATAEALDDDGWLHTGDIGALDDDGFLRITDRKKDLIKTSSGKFVAPQEVEGRLKAACPYLSQVLVHGNNRNFCSALVTLDDEAIRGWAKENSLGNANYKELAASDKVHDFIQTYVDALNRQLARYETIKKFAILAEEFTVEAGLLTPSLKLKRRPIETRFAEVLDGFYAGALEAL